MSSIDRKIQRARLRAGKMTPEAYTTKRRKPPFRAGHKYHPTKGFRKET